MGTATPLLLTFGGLAVFEGFDQLAQVARLGCGATYAPVSVNTSTSVVPALNQQKGARTAR